MAIVHRDDGSRGELECLPVTSPPIGPILMAQRPTRQIPSVGRAREG